MRHRSFWPMAVFLGASIWPANGQAAGRFDAASDRAAHGPTRHLSWMHTLGAGANRLLVVGVTAEASGPRGPEPSVTFNGVPLVPVPGGTADSGGRGHARLRTQLFYLLEAGLPPAGRYLVVLSQPHHTNGLAGGAISMLGLAQAPPEAVAASASEHPAAAVTSTLTTLTPQAWIVDAVGADVGHPLWPTTPEQHPRYAARSHDLSVAGGAAEVADPGTYSLGWRLHGRGRLAHAAAAFAPVLLPLSVKVMGWGVSSPPVAASSRAPRSS